MIFNLFSYCDGFLKAPTLGQNNPIDNLSQQSNTTSEKDNFVPLVQETANVNFELESELNELATNKPFGNTVPQDEWKSDEVGGFFVKGGGLEQKGKTDKAHDIVYKAKRVGYRYTDERAKKLGLSSNAKPTQEHIEKYLGNGVYKEDRADRSDKSRMKKLNRGGTIGEYKVYGKVYFFGEEEKESEKINKTVFANSESDAENKAIEEFENEQGVVVDEYRLFADLLSDSEYAGGGGLEQKGKTDKAHDIVYKAKRVGYRYTDERAKKLGLSSNAKPTQEHIEKYLGNGVYKEDRANRSDKSRMKKLNRGGSAGNKAIMQKIQDEVRKLKAENPNMFEKHTDFVKKAASNLKYRGEI